MSKRYKEYRVTVEVGVTAKSRKQAVEFALSDLRNTELGPWSLDVKTPGGKPKRVWSKL
jgi:hypothetical protein